MHRKFVNELGHQESIDQVFQANQMQLRTNRNGSLYLLIDLSDRTGTISTRMWNVSESDMRGFSEGDFVRVEGTTQLFQGAMQMIATHIEKARLDEFDEADFVVLPSTAVDRLVNRLTEILRSLKCESLRALGETFLMDEEFMAKFMKAPAGVKNHHAYPGGLMEHVVSLLQLVEQVVPCYPQLNRDMLIMGAFLHDIGKIDELAYDHGFSYTDVGQLVGHVVMGVSILEEKARAVEKLTGEGIPSDVMNCLKHMIVSHHGEYEFGSPKLPMTVEALTLHLLDNLDAKLHSFQQIIRDDPNVNSSWTTFNPTLGRKLYKFRNT